MARMTKKHDWLNDLLASVSGMLVSGHPSFSERIGLRTDDTVVLRFVGNRRQTIALILTILSDMEEWGRTKRTIASSPNARQIIMQISTILGARVCIVLCDNDIAGAFSVSDDLESFHDADDQDLLRYFERVNIEMTQNPGTYKEINISINDSFQRWTRQYLSRYLVVNDLDALLLSKPAIFELKRVKEDIADWRPYVDDSANYAALMLICKNAKIPLRVIAYQVDNRDLVALHQVQSATKACIEGRVVVCRPTDIVRNPPGTSYTSCRRRQS